jgi:hypothetical protein
MNIHLPSGRFPRLEIEQLQRIELEVLAAIGE